MSEIKSFVACVLILLTRVSLVDTQVLQAGPGINPTIYVRTGFSLRVAHANTRGARFMTFAPDGALLVSHPDPNGITRITGLGSESTEWVPAVG